MVILWRRVLAGGPGSMTGRRSHHTEGVKPEARGLTPAIWSPSFRTRMATGSVLHKAGTCNPISEAWTHLRAHTNRQTQTYIHTHTNTERTACYCQAAENIPAEGFSMRGDGVTASLTRSLSVLKTNTRKLIHGTHLRVDTSQLVKSWFKQRWVGDNWKIRLRSRCLDKWIWKDKVLQTAGRKHCHAPVDVQWESETRFSACHGFSNANSDYNVVQGLQYTI